MFAESTDKGAETMTRKDYILIADSLRMAYAAYQQPTKEGIEAAAIHLAASLAQDNPRFDRIHFLAVVRGEKDLNSRPARR